MNESLMGLERQLFLAIQLNRQNKRDFYFTILVLRNNSNVSTL